MHRPKLPPFKKVIFSDKAFTSQLLNSLFKKLREAPQSFLGVLKAESNQGLVYLFILHGEPYAAGGWLEQGARPLTLHEFFQTLVQSDQTRLSLFECDPVYLKCLLTLFQKKPATQATTDLVSIEGLLERLKQDSGENLLVLRKDQDYNFFYYIKKRLLEGYFSDPAGASQEDSLEERLLSYVYQPNQSFPIELLLYNDLEVIAAPDVRSAGPDESQTSVVDHYLRPCPQLIMIGPNDSLQKIQIHKKIFRIGRAASNDLLLDDPLVSRNHATLFRQGDGYAIRDEKSRNGVLVNGKAVTEAGLNNGDKLQIGVYHLQFLLNDRSEPVRMKLPGTGTDETMLRTDLNLLDGKAKRQPRCWLEVVVGPLRGTRFEISEVRTVIGRSQADFVLKDPKVSRQHATIEWTEDGYRFVDHGSTNGSYVNDQRVSTHRLVPGDMIRIGGTTIKLHIVE